MGTQFNTSDPLLLNPGEIRIVTPTPDEKGRGVSKIAVREGTNWKLISNRIAVIRPGQRMTGVIVYSPSGRINTYTAEEIAEYGKPKPGHFWITYSENAPTE